MLAQRRGLVKRSRRFLRWPAAAAPYLRFVPVAGYTSDQTRGSVKIRVSTLSVVVACALGPRVAAAQAVEITEGQMKPYFLNPDEEPIRVRGGSKPPTAFTTTYVMVYQGPSGSIQSGPSTSMLERTIVEQYAFPSLAFTISAAARIITEEELDSGDNSPDVGRRTELQKMNAHVRIVALDASKRPLALVPVTPAARATEASQKSVVDVEKQSVVVLAIYPSESVYRTGVSDVTKAMDSVSLFTRYMGPIEGVVSGVTAAFRGFFPTKDTPNQIAYQSGDTEFGWTWQDSEQFGIEGIHQCAAMLRVRKEVKYLQVHVDMVTEWRRFGAWMKPVDFVMPLATPEDLGQ